MDTGRALINIFFSVVAIHNKKLTAAQVLWWAKIITLFMWFVATHALNTRKLIGSLAPSHRFVSRIRSLNGVEWVRSSILQDTLLNKQFQLSPVGTLASRRTWNCLATKVGTT